PPDKPQLSLNELRGHPVVLDFWATWCGPCQAQSPIVDTLFRRFQDKGLVVLGINTNDEEDAARHWVRTHRISYPIVYDNAQTTARAYGVESLPTLVVISREGRISAVRIGLTDAAELESLVQAVLP